MREDERILGSCHENIEVEMFEIGCGTAVEASKGRLCSFRPAYIPPGYIRPLAAQMTGAGSL